MRYEFRPLLDNSWPFSLVAGPGVFVASRDMFVPFLQADLAGASIYSLSILYAILGLGLLILVKIRSSQSGIFQDCGKS